MTQIITAGDQRKARGYCIKIREAWQKSVGGIIETGKLLIEAKKEVGHGSWQWMFSDANDDRLPFVDRTARVLMAVANHPILSNRSHGSDLPASYRTLYDLSRVPDDVLLKALADGLIRPETQRKDIKALLPKPATANWRDAPSDISRDVAEGILPGDFRELCADLPSNSVDLIFTDPPYDRDSLPLYEAAAEQAVRVLRPGGSLIMYCGQYLMPDIINASIAQGMRYWWTAACVHDGGRLARMTEYGIVVHWKPLLWFVKGTRGDKHTFIDDIIGTGREKDAHQWQQAVGEAEYFIARLTPPNGLVVDFFCGGGTTLLAADRLGRKWRSYEIDPDARNVAIQRIATDRATRQAQAA